MRLLVSVVDAAEAALARAGGADVVDLKDPAEGSLGAPAPATVAAVARGAGGAPVSVALGDLPHLPHTAALAAAGAAASGATIVKVGLRGSRTPQQARQLLRAVADAVADRPGVQVVAAAYADGARLPAPPLPVALLPDVAHAAGVSGCLLDTAVKDGRGLLDWLSPRALRELAGAAHAHGLTLGLAGQLRLAQLAPLRATGADLVGVRSAVCAGAERAGPLDARLVRRAVAQCAPSGG